MVHTPQLSLLIGQPYGKGSLASQGSMIAGPMSTLHNAPDMVALDTLV